MLPPERFYTTKTPSGHAAERGQGVTAAAAPCADLSSQKALPFPRHKVPVLGLKRTWLEAVLACRCQTEKGPFQYDTTAHSTL